MHQPATSALDRGAVVDPLAQIVDLKDEDLGKLSAAIGPVSFDRSSAFLEQGLQQGPGQVLHAHERDFILASGTRVDVARLGFCLYGSSPDNPLVVVHPALTGSPRACRQQHAAKNSGRAVDTQGDGWWDEVIGAGKLFDTSRFTIMCVAHLGGNGHSSSVVELAGHTVSIADTVRLAAQVLRRNGVSKIAAIVGGSMGAYQALQWLYEDELTIGSIFDICGSSPGCETTAEFFATQRDLLAGADPCEVAERLRANCAALTKSSEAFALVLEHVVSRVRELSSRDGDGGSSCLAVARQIGFLRFVAPGFYEQKMDRYLRDANESYQVAGMRLTDWIDLRGVEFRHRFNPLALHSLCGMLAAPPDISTSSIAALLEKKKVTLNGLSVNGDTLWPSVGRDEFYSKIRAALPDDLKSCARHVVVSDEINGHDFFLSQAFPESEAVRELFDYQAPTL